MKILNFGSANIDHVYKVPHFLKPGETMPADSYARFPGGKGFNQSVALARAGADVYHAGHVGADGAWLVDFLRKDGVNVDFLTVVDTPTGHGIIQVAPDGQNCILIEGGANQCLTKSDIRAALAGAAIGAGDVVLLQNETSCAAEIIRLAAATGAKVAFNTAPYSDSVADLPLDLVGLFIVNELEGAALAGMPGVKDGYRILNAIRSRFPEADVLLTLGAGGALYGRHEDRTNSTMLPANSVKVVDTTAAGDTFIGYFLAALGEGALPLMALDRATRASAFSVSHAGAAPSIPHPGELATPWDQTQLRGVCDKDPVSYKVGETMTFTIAFADAPDASCADGYTVRWTRSGDDGVKEEGSVPAADVMSAPLVIRTSLACPGFVHLYVDLHGPDGRPVCRPVGGPGEWWPPQVFFDGGAGAEIEKLHGEQEPADFDAYWDRQKARLAAVPLRADCVEVASPDPEVRVFAVSVDCAGPRPVTGYFSVPRALPESGRLPARVYFHGYGTGYNKSTVPPIPYPRDALFFDVNAHGMELERDYRYYNDFFLATISNGYSYGFDPAQNKNPEDAYFNNMALRVMRALQFVKARPEWDGETLEIIGGSQGGLQTSWAAGLDHDVTLASPEVPWCCDLAGINTNRVASAWHIPYVPAIDYFDPINHAKRIKCRVNVPRAGLGDYTCPPSGIAIFYNNLRCEKSIRWLQGSQHGYIPPEPNQAQIIAAQSAL